MLRLFTYQDTFIYLRYRNMKLFIVHLRLAKCSWLMALLLMQEIILWG